MIKPYLLVASSNGKGRGVFTTEDIRSKSIIEISPVIVLPAKDRKTIDQTLMHDYIFEWGDSRRQACIALGYVSLYNHSFASNCEYEMDYEYQLITIRTVRSIKKGEELTINYNGTWNDTKALWFEVTH